MPPPNFIQWRDNKFYCIKCCDYIANVTDHLKQHGMVHGPSSKNKWAGTNKMLETPKKLGEFIPNLDALDNPYKPSPEEIEKDRKWGVTGP